jgi:hypothetical protein
MSAVALLRDLGQRSPDLLVGPSQDEVADLQGLARSACNDAVYLDDFVRRRESERASAEEENDETEGGDRVSEAMEHETPPIENLHV